MREQVGGQVAGWAPRDAFSGLCNNPALVPGPHYRRCLALVPSEVQEEGLGQGWSVARAGVQVCACCRPAQGAWQAACLGLFPQLCPLPWWVRRRLLHTLHAEDQVPAFTGANLEKVASAARIKVAHSRTSWKPLRACAVRPGWEAGRRGSKSRWRNGNRESTCAAFSRQMLYH